MKTSITEHFTLEELTHSDNAVLYKIDNTPSASVRAKLENLAKVVLEPARQWLGEPIKVSSGYRSPEVNKKADGKPNSQHLRGEAADLKCKDEATLWKLFCYIRDHLTYDQLLFERKNNQSKTHWLHVSCKLDIRLNRKQCNNDYLKYK